jgi:hypothetical protein
LVCSTLTAVKRQRENAIAETSPTVHKPVARSLDSFEKRRSLPVPVSDADFLEHKLGSAT